jgi:hypothetical protein
LFSQPFSLEGDPRAIPRVRKFRTSHRARLNGPAIAYTLRYKIFWNNAGHFEGTWYHRGCGAREIALAGNKSAFASPSFGCNCLISFILLKARINGGLFSVPAPPTYCQVSGGVFYFLNHEWHDGF